MLLAEGKAQVGEGRTQNEPERDLLHLDLFGTVALLARCKRLQQVMAAFREIVMRYVVAVLTLLLGISSSLAQSHMGTPQEQQACSRDASRFCRQLLGNDSAVQQCLQQNRSRLSRSCQKVFASHGM